MEGDSSHKHNEQESSNPVSYIGHLFQPFRLRCPIRVDNEVDRVLLGYGLNFLPSFGIIFWLIFLIF
jgi:hypothetical protein